MKTFVGYFRYLAPYRGALLLGMLFSALFGGSGFLVPAIGERALGTFFPGDATAAVPTAVLIGYASALVGVFVFRGVCGFVGGWLMTYCAVKLAIDLRCDLFDRLQSFELGYFAENSSGDLIARVNEDTREFEQALLDVAADSIRQPAQMLFGLGALIYFSVQHDQAIYILLFLIAAPVLIVPTRLIASRLRKRGRQYQDAVGEVTSHLAENLAALEEIRAFQLEPEQSRGFREKVHLSLMTYLRLRTYWLTQQPSMEIISVFVLAPAFVYAYYSGLEQSVFLALFMAIYFTVDPIKRVMRAINLINRTEGPMQRIQAILDREPAIADPADPTPLERVGGEVRFRGVRFSYGGREEEVLRGVDVEIPAGQVVALVGPSGAGKSTFTKLIPRLYDASAGAVEVDGVDVRQVRQADLRRHIALVTQQPVLFDEPLRTNLAYGRPGATDAEIEAAAKAAYAHEFITRFEQGYDTAAGESGGRLSVGQKQRVAIARAFLREAPILILDEATSALDAESEELVQKALAELVRGKTVLLIAHRFSSIRLADRILVFDEGRIVEDGTHEELMARRGVYHGLHQRQTLSATPDAAAPAPSAHPAQDRR